MADPATINRMETGSPHPLRVVAAVFLRDNTVLACRRAPGRSAAGRWEFPGGKIEPGETAEQALRREIDEELSVEATVGALLDRSRTAVGPMTIDLACYLIAAHHPDPTASTDHDQLRWQPITALGDLTWAAPDLPAVAKVSAMVGNRSHDDGSTTASG